MQIGIDLDEVLGDLMGAFIRFHNDSYGTSLAREDFHSYNFWEIFGGTREQAIQKVHDFHKTPYFQNIQPIEGAQESVDVLRQNHELVVVTGRQNPIVDQTRQWIAQYFPNAFKGIHTTNIYSQSGKSRKKSEVCTELGIDVLIDDYLENIVDCATNGTRGLLFGDYAWNRCLDKELPKNVKRVLNWDMVLRELNCS